ncbi:MAG: MFS transporter [Anaerolineales bacterium]|nr:MFS transporter [Anaerolineales bacterium]
MINKSPSGMFAFSIVWVGQAVSLLGTSMTAFALTIWAYELTGTATALALAGFFHVTPLLIFSPIAGAIVDRSNRKLMMMLSDLGSGIAAIGILVLFMTGQLELWHLFVANAITGIFQTFQWPAYSAAITMIVPKKHYARAHAMNELAGNTSGIFAPLLAGALLPFIGLGGILTIDIITFLVAVGALLIVKIPQPEATEEGAESRGSIWKESAYGFRYIFKRPSLLGLQTVFMIGNFFATMAYTLFAPMVLARTDSNSLIYGSVQTAGAIGGVFGGLLMSAWGGTKKKVYGVLSGWFIAGFGTTVIGLGQALPVWAVGNFIGAATIPLINSSNQAIWQAKVAPDLQGRVFATRRMIAWFVTPIATLLVGPLADLVFEPAMSEPSFLSASFGPLVGYGAGAGMALIMVFCGLAMAGVGVGSYGVRVVRDAESILPDHQVTVGASADTQEKLQDLLAERQALITLPSSPERDQKLKEIGQELRNIGRR